MPPDDRPNILLIHADQHRWDCLGAYGNPDVRTPNIDRLAADGVRYDNSFCAYPVCTPSRYSLLTGLYVHQHLGWTNHCTLPRTMPTFPRILRDAGYRTAAVGKMHFTPTYLDVGFQEMFLAEQDGPGRFDDDYHRYLRDRGLADRFDVVDQRQEYRKDAPQAYRDCFGAAESDLPEEHYSTTWIAERAMEQIARWDGGGNLLMVGFIKPHHPFDPPAPWSRMYDPDRLTLLPGWTEQTPAHDLRHARGYFPNDTLTEARVRHIMAMYYATISQIDHHVGRMLEQLCARGLYDRTMVLYTSDHGDYVGFHHMVLKGNHLYDPLVKVPLIVKYPAGVGAGTVSDALNSNVDVAPTILARAGCEAPRSLAGMDLLANPAGRERVFTEGWGAGAYMVRSRTRKLLWCRQEDHSQLLDLQADPLEMHNLIDDPARRDEVRALREDLARWALFDAPSRTYLDEYAETIDRPNVRSLRTGHRDEIVEYFRRQVEATPPRWADRFAEPPPP